MSLGAALGGWTVAYVGYQAAFIINAAFVSCVGVFRVAGSRGRDTSSSRLRSPSSQKALQGLLD